MTEREEAGMELLLREMLSSAPEIVAWLEPQTTRTTATSRGNG